jgi:hypothetical protein
MAKKPGKSLLLDPACEPFRDHLAAAKQQVPAPTAWSAVEPGFILALEVFDDIVSAGNAGEGARQNGKGDYFNDLVALILENCSGVTLNKRSGVPGLVFLKHTLDVTYPATGSIIEVMVEAKMMGTPKHPGNPEAGPEGRPGSADMLKRCKESGFKTIDLKAGYGYKLSQAGAGTQAPIQGDLTSWLRTVKPSSYMVFGVRVVSKSDLAAVVSTAMSMTQVVDGVGVAAYRPKGYKNSNTYPAAYEPVAVPNNIALGTVLHRLCLDLQTGAQAAATHADAALDQIATPSQQISQEFGGEATDEEDDDA